jgi:hypothetical protein
MGSVGWSPAIGDPTVIGWVTVFAYFGTAWLCLRAFNAEKHGPRRSYRQTVPAVLRVLRKSWPHSPAPARRAALWLLLAVLLVFLGVNKQLDLQSLATKLGSALARQHGWYEHRRAAQAGFIGLLLVVSVVSLLKLRWLVRGQSSDFRLPLLGLTCIGLFVLVRASVFYKVDVLLGFKRADVPMIWILELTGLGLVAASAIQRLRGTASVSPPAR